MIYIKQGQPNQWTLAFEGLENPNFLDATVQCVCGHGGCSGSIQAKHHFVHVHHPPFDLLLRAPQPTIESLMIFISTLESLSNDVSSPMILFMQS